VDKYIFQGRRYPVDALNMQASCGQQGRGSFPAAFLIINAHMEAVPEERNSENPDLLLQDGHRLNGPVAF
jgi:hypothetical protein